MNLTILCMACNTPLLTTTPERLGWPLHGNMFSMLMPNWTLRDMPLYLEYWCPVCHNFPFYADGTETGYKGVGRYLNVLVEGRPLMMSVEALKVLPPISSPPGHTKANPAQDAKPHYRKPAVKQGNKPKVVKKPPGRPKKVAPAPVDPFLATLEKRVKRGGFAEDANNLPPTPEEIADLARDRESRSNGRPEPQLRAME